MEEKIIGIFSDGSGWNGTTAAYCVWINGKKEVKVFYEIRSAGEMEYLGMIKAMQLANPGQKIHTDSKMVEGQLMKGWKVRNEKLKYLSRIAWGLLVEKNLEVVWVSRKKNPAGWYLEKRLKKINLAHQPSNHNHLTKEEKKKKYATNYHPR